MTTQAKIEKELERLIKSKNYGKFSFINLKPIKRTEIHDLIVYVSDTRKLHDSGFPYIRIWGNIGKGKYIDLGWHDHYIISLPANIDALGKNIFHIMPWRDIKFWICGNNMWYSTFEIKEDGELR